MASHKLQRLQAKRPAEKKCVCVVVVVAFCFVYVCVCVGAFPAWLVARELNQYRLPVIPGTAPRCRKYYVLAYFPEPCSLLPQVSKAMPSERCPNGTVVLAPKNPTINAEGISQDCISDAS